MNANLTVGTKVVQINVYKHGTFRRCGEVVENPGLGRLRVRWSHTEGPDYRREDGKRTWVKGDTVSVVIA